MCTAATYKTKDFYFGRTLDYEISYGEEITITPRDYPFYFRHAGAVKKHYAMIGLAHISGDYPLYYDGVNEKGLGIAGLNFVGNAVYHDAEENKYNIAQFEIIPWILTRCASVAEARELLKNTNITPDRFDNELPVAQLHWIISDSAESITVESVAEGLMIYDNPVGILTNNPPFTQQMFQLNNYMYLSTGSPQNNFCSKLPLHAYSRGMGAMGLPGDLSSQSRFIRAVFVKMNSVSGDSESESLGQFFHILGSVIQQKGCCVVHGSYEITLITTCCNTDKGIYYYNTYDNHQISAVDMYKENLDSERLIRYPVIQGEHIKYQN